MTERRGAETVSIELLQNWDDNLGSHYQFIKDGNDYPFLDIDFVDRGGRQIISSQGPYRLEQILKNRLSPARPSIGLRTEIYSPHLEKTVREQVAQSLAEILFKIREIS